jgi:hypothetical protein
VSGSSKNLDQSAGASVLDSDLDYPRPSIVARPIVRANY